MLKYFKIFLKNNIVRFRFEVAGFFLLLFVVIANVFPDGYSILGGDIIQQVNWQDNIQKYFYEWHGRALLFYIIFYFLELLGVSDTVQLSWYLGIFLFGSYVSFLFFSALIFPEISKKIKTITALFYSTNIYTLYIFTATWGYTSYQAIYVFIPVLTGLYIKFLSSKKEIYGYLFLLFIFLSSSSFGNPAFALSLGIFFFLLTVCLFLFRYILWTGSTVKRILIIIIGSFLVNIFWILPIFPQMSAGIQEVNISQDVNLSESLRKTSNAISDTLRLMSTSEQKRYYPINFPYPSFSWLKDIISVMAFIPILLLVAGYISVKKQNRYRETQLFGVFLALLAIFVLLVARVRFPFESINEVLFHLPGFNTLRGRDKLATFTPFIVSVPILLSFMVWEKRTYFKGIFLGFFALTILLALPFYAGGLQTRLSYILYNQKAKNFEIAKQSALVKIPEDYHTIAAFFKEHNGDYKLAMLPFSPGSSVGRVDLPKWKVNGPHVARVLYNKQYIDLTEQYIPGWDFEDDLKNDSQALEWIFDLYGLLGVQYIFYHKDAKIKNVEQFEKTRPYLEQKGVLKNVSENPWFTLYELNSHYIFPYVYSSAGIYENMQMSAGHISEDVEKIRTSTIERLSYRHESPKEIIIDQFESFQSGRIVLNERYDSLWVAFYIPFDGNPIELKRDLNVKHANAWEMSGDSADGYIKIYYKPVKLFYIGMFISGMTLIFIFFRIVVYFRRNNKFI